MPILHLRFHFHRKITTIATGRTPKIQVQVQDNPNRNSINSPFILMECAESCTYYHLVQGCIKRKSLADSKLIHAHIILTGFEPDRYLQNVLVNMYVKCGSLLDARRVFDQMGMDGLDSSSWTVMIAGYSKHRFPHTALALFGQMQAMGCAQSSEFTFSSVISACGNLALLKLGMEIHGQIVTSGVESHVSVGNALAGMYAKCGKVRDARQVFDKMCERGRDIVSWTVMVAAYARHGPAVEALALFHCMEAVSVEPNQFIFSGVVSACAKLGVLEQGMRIHEEIIRRGFEGHLSVANALIDMYVKCGSPEKARELFDKIPQRDVVSWTVMLAAYAKHGAADEVLRLFHQMQQTGCQPNQLTLASVLSACTNSGSFKLGMEIHDEIVRCGFQFHVSVVNALINMYSNFGRIDKAYNLFDKMPRRDVVSWNSMITGFAQNGLVEEALKLFQRMPQRDIVSWNALIAGYVQNGLVDNAMELYKEMPEQTMFSWTTMIAGYAQTGNVNEALKLFWEMPLRDTVSWNAIIAGLARNGHDEESLQLFREMQLAGLNPDSQTFASILPACANLAALEHGIQIHEEIIRSGFQHDILAVNALIDMYAKSGSIQKASELFDKMNQRDNISWSSMIGAYAMHGFGKDALKLFEQMEFSGMTPDHITLVSVLSACSHAGLVDEGYKYFNCMSEYYHITPRMEHYQCMVDLLGRAGRLDEVLDFICKMPIKPDASVWNCLLGSCRIHDNVKLGEYAAERVFELNPKNAAPYVLLSNIYVTAGRWDDIEKVRKMLKESGAKKTPGCSWIEINKQVHSFLVGDDMLHPDNLCKSKELLLGDEGNRSISIQVAATYALDSDWQSTHATY